MQEAFSIYIHFPYCKSRCPYCDFFRALKPRDFDENALAARYMADLDYFMPYVQGRKVKSVFFGGGTPSLLSSETVARILDGIATRLTLLPRAEISLEANPNSYERGKFQGFRAAGINRLSLGVQALNEPGLKFLGRTHTLAEALQAIEAGMTLFPKFSLDLIYARPGQRWEDWQKEIDQALSFGLRHISLYQLALEEGTVFFRKNIRGLDENAAAKLYEQTVSYLRTCGLERYEVSNFAAARNDESVHNLVYWQGGDYIGLGDGAHGRLRHQGKIYATVDGKTESVLTAQERAEELILMGLRLKEGIRSAAFAEACGLALTDCLNGGALAKYEALGLLQFSGERLALTDKGFLFLDKVILDLVS